MLSAVQLEQRKQFVGASEISMLTGHSPYGGPWELYLAKTGGPDTRKDSFQRELGNLLEPVVLELYRRRTGRELTFPGTIVDDDLPIGCTPDAFDSDGALIEAKTCMPWHRDAFGKPGSADIPIQYMGQVQFAMHVSGKTVCRMPVLFGTQDFAIFEVHYDASIAEAQVKLACEFWHNHVEPRIPPQIDESKACTTFLAEKYLGNGGKLRRAGELEQWLVTGYRAWRQKRDLAQTNMERNANELRDVIGESEGVIGDGFKATWKRTVKGNRVLRVKFDDESEAANDQ